MCICIAYIYVPCFMYCMHVYLYAYVTMYVCMYVYHYITEELYIVFITVNAKNL